MTAVDQPVGFIGLGNMGSRMASHLTGAVGRLIGFDPAPGAVERVGAEVAGSAADVAASAEIILLSLPDSRVIESVTLGTDGIVTNARPGQVFVDLSTASPASTRRIAAVAAERGAHFLDCGISGGAAAAEQGRLTLMIGGDATEVDRVQPVLSLFSDRIFHMGGSGSGHTAKLLNNFLNAIALSATAEVMVAAKKAGLDLAQLLEVLNSSSGVNFATLNRFPRIITGDYLEGGLTNALMMKDVTLYGDLLAQLGVSSPNSSAPLASFGLAVALGYGARISNTVVDAIGDISGGVRLAPEGAQ